jgi:hypothetical protein
MGKVVMALLNTQLDFHFSGPGGTFLVVLGGKAEILMYTYLTPVVLCMNGSSANQHLASLSFLSLIQE